MVIVRRRTENIRRKFCRKSFEKLFFSVDFYKCRCYNTSVYLTSSQHFMLIQKGILQL